MDLLQAAVYILRRSGVPMSAKDVAQSVVKADLADIDPQLSLDEVTEALYAVCIQESGPVCELDDQVLSLVEWAIQEPPDNIRLVAAEVEPESQPQMEEVLLAEAVRGVPEAIPMPELELEQEPDEIELPEPPEPKQPLGSRVSIANVTVLVQNEPGYPFFAHTQECLKTMLVWGGLCVLGGIASLIFADAFWHSAGIIWLVAGLVFCGLSLYELRKNYVTDQAVMAGVLNKKMVNKQVAGYRLGTLILLITGGLLLILGMVLGWVAETGSSLQGFGLGAFSQGMMALVLVALDWWYGQGEVASRK